MNNAKIQAALQKAQSLVELIDILAQYYDIQNNRPTEMILKILTTAIQVAVGIQDKDVVAAALKSVTLYDFLMTFAQYYDSVHSAFDPAHRQQMIDKLGHLLTITRVKSK